MRIFIATLALAAAASLAACTPEDTAAPLPASTITVTAAPEPRVTITTPPVTTTVTAPPAPRVTETVTAPFNPVTPTPRALVPCANEDGSGGPLPCFWDAKTRGNGQGRSYTVTIDEEFVYID